MIKPYEELANAIVLQAVKDWRDAAAILMSGRRNMFAEDMKAECERFFMGRYFNEFTALDGSMILEGLKKEVES